MKYTDQEFEKLLNRLVASTRSPRGKYSSATSYPKLERRLPQHKLRFLKMHRLGAVAAVALLCILAWSTYYYLLPVSMETVSTLAHNQTVRLSDGTEIILNHFSSITYPERFRKGNREVMLKGEAYFEVAKDKKHPFIVHAETVNIEVLGTHFNVEAYPGDPEIKTTLLEGSVAVSNDYNAKRIILKPDESAIYNKISRTLTLTMEKKANDEISWVKGELIFSNLPLEEIVRQLSNRFGVEITIKGENLRNYKVTGRFMDGEDLDRILELLQTICNFSYTKTNQQITIIEKE